MARDLDPADGAADDHLAQRQRWRIARTDLVHQVAHVRIQRQVQRAQQHLSFAGHGHRLA